MFNDNGSFLLALLEFFLFFAWLMCLFWVFSDIFRSHDLGGAAKALWLVFVIVLPYLGVFVYLIARGAKMAEHNVRQAEAQQAAVNDYIRQTAGTSPSPAAELERLAALKAAGTIDDAEFARLKANVLS